MPKIDPNAVAVNAAGIADAFHVLQAADDNGAARLEELTLAHEGWCGVMLQIAEAGEIMERYRHSQGVTATWGGDLPSLYSVWDAIARVIWERLGIEPLDGLVRSAIEQAVHSDAV
jgi:hypothetical protein